MTLDVDAAAREILAREADSWEGRLIIKPDYDQWHDDDHFPDVDPRAFAILKQVLFPRRRKPRSTSPARAVWLAEKLVAEGYSKLKAARAAALQFGLAVEPIRRRLYPR